MKIRKWIFTLAAFLLLMTMGFAMFGKTEASAASPKYYQVHAQFIDKFNKTNNKLKLKCEKNSIWKSSKLKDGTELVNLKIQKSGMLNLKVASNCKWKWIDLNYKKHTVSYPKIKKSVKKERKLYKEWKKEGYKISKNIGENNEYETGLSVILVVHGKTIHEVVAHLI